MNWIYLIIAGLLEIGFTTSMKMSNNFTNLKWSLSFAGCIILSFYFVNKACQTLPLGTAYAVWTGIGASGTLLFGMFFLGESRDLIRIGCILLIIACIIVLKVTHS